MIKDIEENFIHNQNILIEKLTPYFFSIIVNKKYTVVRIFGIKITIKNKRFANKPIVITFSNVLRFLFSISNKNNGERNLIIIRLCGFRISLKK